MTRAPIDEPAKTIAPVGHDRPVADLGGWQRLALGGRSRGEDGLLADDGVLEHPDALPEHVPG